MNKIKQESQQHRLAHREALFNAKRFWNQQSEQIELEFQDKQEVRKFCKQFQSFEYYAGLCLTQKEYFIRILPAGERCLVISFQNKTIIQTANGQKYSTKSALPGGGKSNQSGQCILDCILIEHTIYIYDILQWGKIDLCDQVAEMRYFWIQGNIIMSKLDCADYTFEWIPLYTSVQGSITNLPKYRKGGMVFIKKDSYYISGVNPECILFRDEHTDDDFAEDMRQFMKTRTIQMNLSLFQGRLKSRDEYEIGIQENEHSQKAVVDTTVHIGELIRVGQMCNCHNFIEDPYSKIVFWSHLPELLYK